ncbi:ATP-binding cassette domain-containing protein [Paracoccus sp. MBLB3053]|uniref:ATP-binding cassette domain-containing protein n=1 Tax=Paracoccus aurantius TaxID=3073814 RepID=A0ABU2HWX8_9RHOB|nr:ATP-binding cassette domain-containing protein [Paracoccus sp. MBLB3053]MDS9469521.1 ATP-binding cassette domain-containing protein [Paracoccus sp. MBLB3053]
MPDLCISGVEMRFSGLDGPALDIPALSIPAGSMLAVTGPSGSGKTTFVNLITGLEKPSTGQIRWGETDIAALREGARDRWRGRNVGMVMQEFHLFPGLSALDNILLPARLARVVDGGLTARAHGLLARVGLPRPDQKVDTMSRGEMQRVAVARAVLREPGIIVADEPTASLDAENGVAIADLLIELASAQGATLIAVSHDPTLIGRLPRRLSLARGTIVAQTEMGASN